MKPTNSRALSVLVIVFFFWGFIAAGNSVFIPFCKHYFNLDQFQSQLIDFAFYTAYYFGALALFAYGNFGGNDLVGKWGYKRSIVFGLLFSALGAGAMIAAVNANSFAGMLSGLFIVALGFSLQQTAANPFAISLGDPSTGTARINLGGGINSFGTTIGPIVVALALFGTTSAITDEQISGLKLSKVIVLYSCVGALFVIAAAIFAFSKKVPSGVIVEKTEKSGKALTLLGIMSVLLVGMFFPVFNSYQSAEVKNIETISKKIESQETFLKSLKNEKEFQDDASAVTAAIMDSEISKEIKNLTAQKESIRVPLEQMRMKWLFAALLVIVAGLLTAFLLSSKKSEGWGAMKYPQLVLGMLAIFVYVGVEVAIGSNLSELLKQPEFGGLASSQAAPYISMYWGSLMIGRWTGSLAAFDFSPRKRLILQFVVPILAFLVIMGANTMAGYQMSVFWYYIICVMIQVLAARWGNDAPGKTLLIFGVLGMLSMLIGIGSSGNIAIYAFLSGGLFCSVMWPCIFNLALSGLGKYVTQGSAFLVMMILGGGIIPPIQGKLSDIAGIHSSYWVAVICFAYLAWYAFFSGKIFQRNHSA